MAKNSEEYEVRLPDGSIRHLYAYASPLFGTAGQVRGAVAALLDITPLQQAHAQIEDAHTRLTSILESITDAFIALDRDWRYTYINRECERYYGRDRDSLLGRTMWESFPTLDRAARLPRAAGAVHLLPRHRIEEARGAGDAAPQPRAQQPHHRAGDAARAAAGRRVDRQCQVHAADRQSSGLRDPRRALWHQCIDGLRGSRSAAAVAAQVLDQRRAGHPRHAAHAHSARTGAPCENMQYEVLRADGSVRSVYGSAAPLFDEQGQVRAVIGAHTDITERKHAEDALREADRRKDEFLATLAHELRNPLSPIRSALAVLRLQAPDGDDGRWPGAVIERQVRQMSRLLDDLLDISRITLNRLELRRERVPLSTIIDVPVETSRPAIEQSRHRLQVRLPEQPVWVDADVTRLAQVFANLLNNAAKYTDAGGSIALTARSAGIEVEVSVEDNGIGIARERLAHVFDMFSQEQPALARSHGGLGIGLALSRALVQLHGGRIEADSGGRGQGSRFTVTLPAVGDPAAPTPRPDAAARAGNASQRRVLVVDDNRDSAESLAIYLDMLGHKVGTAHDGDEALRVGAQLEPEAVLLDIGLPGKNGYEVAQAMRATAWGANALLMAITGWGQAEDKRRAIEAGFDVHMTKPVDPEAIAALLADIEANRRR